MQSSIKTENLKISGMTCISCENKIKKKLKRTDGILAVEVSYTTSTCRITYDEKKITREEIFRIIEELDYQAVCDGPDSKDSFSLFKIVEAAVVLFAAYLVLRQTGLLDIFYFFPQAEAGMGYGMLFLTGLFTSIHCVAMCGGINLSQTLSRGNDDDGKTDLKPGILYNAGRVISYTVIGGLAGVLGSVISFSGGMKGIVQLLAGIFMVIMGLNMLNVFPWLRRFNPRMPKIFADKIQAKKRGNGPFYIGLLNGLMPCGPLQAMQLYALSTGDPLKGAFSMFLFSIGTVPLMFLFGLISSVLSRKFTNKVMTAGAVLVVILGISMFSSGMALSGLSANPSGGTVQSQASAGGDVQLIETTLSARRYEPITVTAGIPVRWVIKAEPGSINGCNNRIFIPEYGIEKKLEYGDNVIEFVPEETGRFTYSCWMGMIRSTITVVEEGAAASPQEGNELVSFDEEAGKEDAEFPVMPCCR